MFKFCFKYTLLNPVDFIFKVGHFFTPVLGHTQQAHDVKMMRRDDVTQTSVRLHFDVMQGWSGGAMVLDKLPVPGRPTIWITVGQGPTALAVGAGGG